jgi:hypothetical protein
MIRNEQELVAVPGRDLAIPGEHRGVVFAPKDIRVEGQVCWGRECPSNTQKVAECPGRVGFSRSMHFMGKTKMRSIHTFQSLLLLPHAPDSRGVCHSLLRSGC